MSETTELIAQQIMNGNINKRTWGDILYNVKVYGAAGNGTTDDTAAIQATIDYAISVGGKAVFFPHGTYKVTVLTKLSSVVLFGDNASFSGISDTISQFGNPSSNLVYNVKDYGAKGDGVADDTASLTKALQTAYIAGGGVVHAPQGIYLLKSQITIPKGVILMGIGSKAAPQWDDPTGWDTTYYGTVFAIDWGAGGSSLANAAFLMSSYTKIIGCSFWYPSQSGNTITPVQYPPTIAHINGDTEESSNSITQTDVTNCVFVNPWIAMQFTVQHDLLNISDVQFYAWSKGIIINLSYDIDRLVDIHANPNFMYRGAWPTNNAYEYSLANSTAAFEIGKADQIYLTRCFAFGFYYGCHIHSIDGTNQPSGVFIVQSGFEYSMNPIRVADKSRRININDVLLGTADKSTALQSLVVSLTADTIPDEISVLNVTSFFSAQQAFLFSNVREFTMDGCRCYGAVRYNQGFEQSAIFVDSCKGFTIKNSHFNLSAGNSNSIGMTITNNSGFSLSDVYLSGQTKAAADAFVGTCTKGRLVRTFITESAGAGVGIATSTDVTSADVLIY